MDPVVPSQEESPTEDDAAEEAAIEQIFPGYTVSALIAESPTSQVYRAKDPAVVGLGLAAIRDVISYAKYGEDSVFPVRYGTAVGVSQTGRF